MKLLKGKPIADKILIGLRKKILKLKTKPTLGVVFIGEDKASKIYINLKRQAAKKIGMDFFEFRFKAGVGENKVIDLIKRMNRNRQVSGVIVQLPLPKKYNTQKIINAIDPKKDVDGFHPKNNYYPPVFPQAIMELIKSTHVKLKNKKSVIIAHSKIFGEAMCEFLSQKKINSKCLLEKEIRKNLAHIKKADILISAVGKPGMIKGEMVKKGAIIIDGGITKKGKKVLGDVDFNSVKDKAAYISHVPGGVGPVTVACLLRNTYLVFRKNGNEVSRYR